MSNQDEQTDTTVTAGETPDEREKRLETWSKMSQKEKKRVADKFYRARDKEAISAKRREQYAATKDTKPRQSLTEEQAEAARVRASEYYAVNKDAIHDRERQKRAARTTEQIERDRQRSREWRERNKEELTAKKRAYARAKRANMTEEERQAKLAKQKVAREQETQEQKDARNAYKRERRQQQSGEQRARRLTNQRAREAANREAYRQRGREYARTTNARYNMLHRQATKRGLEVSITPEEFESLIKCPCVYCGDMMERTSEVGSGLDRIDNNKGYHIDNVNPCCSACNVVRHDILTVEETHAAIQAVLGVRGKEKPKTERSCVQIGDCFWSLDGVVYAPYIKETKIQPPPPQKHAIGLEEALIMMDSPLRNWQLAEIYNRSESSVSIARNGRRKDLMSSPEYAKRAAPLIAAREERLRLAIEAVATKTDNIGTIST